MTDTCTEKRCNHCNEVRPMSAFPKYSSKDPRRQHLIYRPECNVCVNAKRRAKAKLHPEKNREYHRLKAERLRNDPVRSHNRRMSRLNNNRQRKFNLSFEAFTLLLEQQGGVCAICGKAEKVKMPDGKPRALAVDHDHKTGEIRGLLCFRCNTWLGMFEAETYITSVHAYLERA